MYLLDPTEKILERLKHNRFLPISESQTFEVDSLASVEADQPLMPPRSRMEITQSFQVSIPAKVVTTLDVKNAFRSGDWNLLRKSLTKIYISPNLAAIFNSYETDDEPQDFIVSTGVPQSSIPGPVLSNTIYNRVINVPSLEEPR